MAIEELLILMIIKSRDNTLGVSHNTIEIFCIPLEIYINQRNAIIINLLGDNFIEENQETFKLTVKGEGLLKNSDLKPFILQKINDKNRVTIEYLLNKCQI